MSTPEAKKYKVGTPVCSYNPECVDYNTVLRIPNGQECEPGFILFEHAYSRPSNWQPGVSSARPRKTIFMHRVSKSRTPKEDEELDVLSVDQSDTSISFKSGLTESERRKKESCSQDEIGDFLSRILCDPEPIEPLPEVPPNNSLRLLTKDLVKRKKRTNSEFMSSKVFRAGTNLSQNLGLKIPIGSSSVTPCQADKVEIDSQSSSSHLLNDFLTKPQSSGKSKVNNTQGMLTISLGSIGCVSNQKYTQRLEMCHQNAVISVLQNRDMETAHLDVPAIPPTILFTDVIKHLSDLILALGSDISWYDLIPNETYARRNFFDALDLDQVERNKLEASIVSTLA